MSHEVTFTIEEDRYTDLTRIKERHGRTWKGLTLEGAKTLSSEMSEANGHSQLYETMRLLRAGFDADEFEVGVSTMFEDESGKETIGIRAKISTSNKKTIQQDLNKIDTALYYSGYNMAIAYGELPSDGELDECVGTILALPIKRGIPEVPNLSQEVVDIVSLQQVHN